MLRHAREYYLISAFQQMTPEQRAAVTLAVIEGRENGVALMEPLPEEAFASFGGEWQEVARLEVPRGELRQRLPPRPRSSCAYNVGIYRRMQPSDAKAGATSGVPECAAATE